MKQKILICLFSIIFGILIGISIPNVKATPTPDVTEIMEVQSGQAMQGAIKYETMVVNGKRVVIFKAGEGENVDIELFW